MYTFKEAVALLDTILGVARRAAEMIITQIGTEITLFPRAGHLASWTGVVPRNHEGAGRRSTGKRRKGNRFLRSVLVQTAAARTNDLSEGSRNLLVESVVAKWRHP